MRAALLLLAVLISKPAFSRESVGSITDSDVAQYQQILENTCKEADQEHGDNPESIEFYCICMMNLLKEGLTQAEWRQAYLFYLNRQPLNELKIIGPHLRKAQSCRNNTY